MPEQYESKYFSGQGPVHIGDRDPATGKPTGLTFVGDIDAASLTPNMERSQKIENVSGNRGIGTSFLKRVDYGLALTFSSIKPDHLAAALHAIKVVKAASSVTDEAVKGYHDKFLRLDHVNVSAVVVTHSSGAPTYAAGTDYVVNLDTGMIEILSTGTITDGQDLLIDYSYAAQHLFKIDPNNTEKYIVFAGINTADNDKQVRCELYKVKIDPGALDMINDDTAQMVINGTVELDSLRPAGDQFYSWMTAD